MSTGKHWKSWGASGSGGTKKPYIPNDMFEMIKVYLPRGTYKLLKEKAENEQIPMSRLGAIAIDNELDSPIPFAYPCPMPTSEFVEYAYTDEAHRIVKFLEKFPAGTSIDSLMLARRDFGIPNRELVMLAIRELLKMQIIEEYKPARTKFNYGPTYRRLRIWGTGPKKPNRPGMDEEL